MSVCVAMEEEEEGVGGADRPWRWPWKGTGGWRGGPPPWSNHGAPLFHRVNFHVNTRFVQSNRPSASIQSFANTTNGVIDLYPGVDTGPKDSDRVGDGGRGEVQTTVAGGRRVRDGGWGVEREGERRWRCDEAAEAVAVASESMSKIVGKLTLTTAWTGMTPSCCMFLNTIIGQGRGKSTSSVSPLHF